MPIELITPAPDYESSYGAYIRDLGNEERYPFPLDFDHEDFPALLARLNGLAAGVGVPDGFVPSSTFWLVDGPDLIGVSNLRHHLNDRLRQHGGHIGLGIRPGLRGRGLGSRLLALTILEARKRGIEDVYVHCHQHNVASARMIVRNGGVLESEGDYQGQPIQRYRIQPLPAHLIGDVSPMTDDITTIYAYRQASPGLATSGQPRENHFPAIAAAGYSTVINLALHDDKRYALPDEPGTVQRLGMTYVHIPVQFGNPTTADLAAFMDAMHDHAGEKIWVHCAANMRVTAFLGLYRVLRQGWNADRAFELMDTVWKPDPVWEAFISAQLKGQP